MGILDDHRRHQLSLPALRRFLRTAAPAAGVRGAVTVRLVDDAQIRDLNRRFLGHDHATDVLSFPAGEPAPGQRAYGGDLAVSLDSAARQAAEQGHDLDTEVRILMLHGLLHLAGMDHHADQGQMRKREIALRRRLRLPAGLIERNVK